MWPSAFSPSGRCWRSLDRARSNGSRTHGFARRPGCSVWPPSPAAPSCSCSPSSSPALTRCRATRPGLIYLHVPVAISMNVGFGLCTLGSLMYLWKKSRWWDTVAVSAAEVGLVYTGLTLVTGHGLGAPDVGRVLDVGRAAHDVLTAVPALPRLPRRASPAGRHGGAQPAVGIRRAARVHRRADRVPVRQLVARAAPDGDAQPQLGRSPG